MSLLDQKVENAVEATQALIKLLERCGEYGWAGRFHPILDALNAYNLDQAVQVYKAIPMPNMGGFLDLYISKQNGHNAEDYEAENKLLEQCRGAVSKSIGNLRVYMQYQLNHPLVQVPNVT